ncbi:hypothetical protein [Calidithermus timidus]|jgi:hypothetical protein|uniref:hypothetical protein n=1 Tax=Calidithermus timidus TaxID=307124 RepID=UPI0004780701|nr:hypothetical protein [Calidithermus timidus]
MTPEVAAPLVIASAVVMALLFVSFVAPWSYQRRAYARVRAISRMSRLARKNNTVLRYHNGLPFVITFHRHGYTYVLEGRRVSRERLIRALGSGAEAVVAKVEREEAMTAPNPTFITLPG